MIRVENLITKCTSEQIECAGKDAERHGESKRTKENGQKRRNKKH